MTGHAETMFRTKSQPYKEKFSKKYIKECDQQKKKNTGRISLKQLLESYEQEKKNSSIAINETTNPPSILTLSIHQKIKIMILIKLFFGPANGKCPLIQIRLNKLIYLIILPLRHLRIHFDEEVTFKHHINKKNNKANKDIEIIRKLNNIFLATLYQQSTVPFIRTYVYYGDVIYDQAENKPFSGKIESVP